MSLQAIDLRFVYKGDVLSNSWWYGNHVVAAPREGDLVTIQGPDIEKTLKGQWRVHRVEWVYYMDGGWYVNVYLEDIPASYTNDDAYKEWVELCKAKAEKETENDK